MNVDETYKGKWITEPNENPNLPLAFVFYISVVTFPAFIPTISMIFSFFLSLVVG
jgi:hypothetical protein